MSTNGEELSQNIDGVLLIINTYAETQGVTQAALKTKDQSIRNGERDIVNLQGIESTM